MSVKYLFKERLEALWNFGLKSERSGEDKADQGSIEPNQSKTVEGVIRSALPLLKRAALLSIFVNLVALFPAVFSLQVYDRVIYRSA